MPSELRHPFTIAEDARQKIAHTQIRVDARPMQPDAAADDPKIATLGGRCLRQALDKTNGDCDDHTRIQFDHHPLGTGVVVRAFRGSPIGRAFRRASGCAIELVVEPLEYFDLSW